MMRFFAICSALLLSLIALLSWQAQSSYSKENRMADSMLMKGAKLIEKKYDLKTIGSGASMPGGPIRELSISFETKKILTKNELRKIIISGHEDFLNLVANDKEIQPFLFEKFNIKNISIMVANHEANGRSACDPAIACASLSDGKLLFITWDPLNDCRAKEIFQESYDEAVKYLANYEDCPLN